VSTYIRALGWGFFGATVGPVLAIVAGYLLLVLGCAVALGCAIGFPVAAIFFPRKLIETMTPTAKDRERARDFEARWRAGENYPTHRVVV